MKAAVFEDIGKIEVKDVPVPEIDENGVLVRVKACAICGSDIRIFHHGNKRVKPPQILGHEIAGEVVEVGQKVTRFKPGDRVAMGGDIPCGECRYCENGMGNICHINYALGYQFPGGFAEYVALNSLAVNYGPVHKIPDNISYDEAALAEPLACVLNGLELSNIKLGDTVVIIGAGPVGCMMIEVARHMGATKIIMVQRSRPRLEIAKKFGADVYICSSEEDAVCRVMEETGGQGADVVIVANSSPEAQAEALKMAGNRARVNFFGGLPRNKSMVTMDTNIIHYREVFVHGSHGASPGHHRKALDLIGSGAIKIGRYISHRFCLDDILEGYKVAESHEGLRVVINP